MLPQSRRTLSQCVASYRVHEAEGSPDWKMEAEKCCSFPTVTQTLTVWLTLWVRAVNQEIFLPCFLWPPWLLAKTHELEAHHLAGILPKVFEECHVEHQLAVLYSIL